VEQEEQLNQAAALLRTAPDHVLPRLDQLVAENRELRRQLERVRSGGSADVVMQLMTHASQLDGARIIAQQVEVGTTDELRGLGDRLRERLGSGAAVLAARVGERTALFAVVTDDLITRGLRADALVKAVAAFTGGTGGGRPHMAQGGVGDESKLSAALAQAVELVRAQLGVP
jgi:alanyl-tRNA synthetase